MRRAHGRIGMDAPYFKCEDCGHEFEKTEFMPDIEDQDIVECPACGGMDIQLVEEPSASDARTKA
jgi:putative FmdB family regulatory protein